VAENETHLLWVALPDLLRAEHEGEAGTSTIARSRHVWWLWHPSTARCQAMIACRARPDRSLIHLLDPTPLLGVPRLQALGELFLELVGCKRVGLEVPSFTNRHPHAAA
jgi:hypothetical protein